jgi:TatD DNase family protein
MIQPFYIDSHCHLQDDQFSGDLDAVMMESRDVGVGAFLVPGTDIETSRRAIELAGKYDDVFAAVGVHPHEASKTEAEYLSTLKELSSHVKNLAIGEVGLDYHYDFSPRERQKEIFREQIELALSLGLPLIIHTRESIEDSFEILDETGGWQAGGVFHCFPGDLSQANYIIDKGMFISYPGLVTFKKADGVRSRIKEIPLSRLLLETDSPYMAPVPYRGKRNSPALLPLIAEKIAIVKNIEIEEVAAQTTANFEKLFIKYHAFRERGL